MEGRSYRAVYEDLSYALYGKNGAMERANEDVGVSCVPASYSGSMKKSIKYTFVT